MLAPFTIEPAFSKGVGSHVGRAWSFGIKKGCIGAGDSLGIKTTMDLQSECGLSFPAKKSKLGRHDRGMPDAEATVLDNRKATKAFVAAEPLDTL